MLERHQSHLFHLAALGAALLLTAGCGEKDSPPAPATAAPPATTPAPAEAEADAVTPTAAEADAATPAPAEADTATAAPAPAAGEPVEIVLWHAYRAGEAAAFDKVVDQYNASQNKIHVRSQAVPYDPFVDKVTITVPRGQGPDLFIFAHNMIGNWVEQGVLEPLSGKIEGDTLKQFLPESVRALVYRKNLYGLPLAMKSLVLFYDKTLVPEPPKTMEELIAKAKELLTGDRQGIVYQAGGLYFHAMWIYAFGGRIFDDAHVPAFDTPEQLAALKFVRKLHMDDKIVAKGISGFMVTSLFNEHKAPFVFNGPWFRPEIAEGMDYGIATIPPFADGRVPKPMLGIEAIFVTKTSKKKEAALEAAKYLAGADSAGVRMREGKQPVCHQATLEAGAAEDPTMKVFLEQASNAVLMDATPEMQLLWTPADIAISAGIFVADRDPAAELKKAQAKMVDDIAKRGK
ncbi:MAG: ABC transporter substrate-binding protein [Deltaproteobacteria bacterium HGW-Deltaproteobacteria-14]|jgi:arabinogalactan oligomer/maltooligosaccharide transport system substrate-binding protein|nr:MAG: ABC transporter substrate-binding protein [Deltaproteobacteria bacterium HGW-Deltaproteobacteria-14]